MKPDRVSILHKAGGLPMAPHALAVARGLTVAQIADRYHGGAHGAKAFVRAASGLDQWEEIPPEMWGRVRPIRDDAVMFTYRLNGGGGRNAFALVAAVALAVAAPYVGTYAATALLGFGHAVAGSLAFTALSTAIAAGVTIGGSILAGSLFQATQPQIGQRDNESKAFADVTTDGNLLARGAYLPVVVGAGRRITPPDLAHPRAYLEDGLQTIERLLGLWGRHDLSNVRVDGTPVTDIAAVTVELVDGDEATGTDTFVDKISCPIGIGELLTTFTLNGAVLEDQTTPANSEPQAIHFATPGHERLEEINIRMQLASFHKTDSASQDVRLPLRIEFRRIGDVSWHKLPEMHVKGRSVSPETIELRVRWDDGFGEDDTAGPFTWDFWVEVPEVTASALSDGSTGTQWQSHSWFDAGSGFENVRYVRYRRHGVRVILDEATFPKGAYEWRFRRGMASNTGTLDSNYQISGTVESLFLSRRISDQWQVPFSQDAHVAQVRLLQATSIADERPVQWPETAQIALKSKGQSVRAVTVEAARYVADWNGSAWANETVTDNPAPHYRAVLADWMTANGLSLSLIDDDALVAWRAECAARGYKVSAVLAGETLLEALGLIATAGFASPVFSHKFGIDWFRDRSGDMPVQPFSHRNTSSITFAIASPERPAGLRARYSDGANEWRPAEIDVTIDNAADLDVYEVVDYASIDDETLVRRRASFDLLQADRRRRIWTVETAIEGVICEKGDLVSVITDLFDDKSHGARILQVIDGTHLVLDQEIPAEAPPPDFGDAPDVADILQVGERSILFIPTASGVVQREIVDASGPVIEIDEALPMNGSEPLSVTYGGQHVSITTLTNARHRCIVTGIARKEGEMAVLTLVDEAPEIWTMMQARFG